MKSKYFKYAVLSDSGFMLAGCMSFESPATIEQATYQAALEAKSIASDREKPFDPLNYTVAVKPTLKPKFRNNQNTCRKVDRE